LSGLNISTVARPATDDVRLRRRANRRAQNREDILDAAEFVFAHDGFRNGSLRKIAERSGFSPGALYLFFENKEQLVAETLARRGDELLRVLHGVADGPLDALGKLHLIIDETIAFFGDRPTFRFLLRHLRSGESLTGSVLADFADPEDSRFHEAMLLIAGIVEAGQASGDIRPGDAAVLAHLYSTLVNEYVLFLGDDATAMDRRFSPYQFHGLVDSALRAGVPGAQ
jgi:AcrR family transcriptional regulator